MEDAPADAVNSHVTGLLRQWEGDDWRIEDVLGRGSFGKVYKISKTEFGHVEYAALKHMELPRDEREIDDLISEGKIEGTEESIRAYYQNLLNKVYSEIEVMKQLMGYTNIVSYSAAKTFEKKDRIGYDVLIRMELLTNLQTRQKQSMTQEDVAKLGVDICSALEILEKRNMIHRDIKPANIFLNSTGDYKLGDFGIAKTMDHTSSFMTKAGTVSYMAPEIYLRNPVSCAADQFSLGIVMYRLLNGLQGPFLAADRRPTSDEEDEAFTRRIRGEAFPPPAYAEPGLAKIILRACAFRPEDRYPNPEAMRQDLQAWLKAPETGAAAAAAAEAAAVKPDKKEEKKERQRREQEEKERLHREQEAKKEQQRREQEAKKEQQRREQEAKKEQQRLAKAEAAQKKAPVVPPVIVPPTASSAEPDGTIIEDAEERTVIEDERTVVEDERTVVEDGAPVDGTIVEGDSSEAATVKPIGTKEQNPLKIPVPPASKPEKPARPEKPVKQAKPAKPEKAEAGKKKFPIWLPILAAVIVVILILLLTGKSKKLKPDDRPVPTASPTASARPTPMADPTATPNMVIPPRPVKLSHREYTLTAGGEGAVLKLANVPEGATLRFESSDPEVAAVSETGEITPTGAGDATITVTVIDGDSELKLECVVHVSEADLCILATAGEGGSIEPSGEVMAKPGETVRFVITPDSGWHIADVLVNGESVGPVDTYELTAEAVERSEVPAEEPAEGSTDEAAEEPGSAQTIEAVFAADGAASYQVTISLSAGTGGTISPSGKNTVEAGTLFTFTVTPNSGYHIADVKVGGSSVGAVSSYSMYPWSSKQVEATFAKNSAAVVETPPPAVETAPPEIETLSLGGQEFKADVTKLVLQSKGISDISVLAKCTSLKELNLNNNSVSDLTPLSGLTSLERLYLNNNNITDISPLANLKKLTTLQLQGNSITDWSPVEFVANVAGRK